MKHCWIPDRRQNGVNVFYDCQCPVDDMKTVPSSDMHDYVGTSQFPGCSQDVAFLLFYVLHILGYHYRMTML
ncbi:hypothetical protein TNCV_2654031 [Trichonephila clavipes]|nr:hypothetical protein TNCV_2654031 [Trichonephila clavipes]